MTERDFKKIPKNTECPFITKIKFKEYKKLVELASLKDKKEVYELHKKQNEDGLGIGNNVTIEELVLADKKTFEGTFIKFYQTEFIASLNTYALKIFVYITKVIGINDNKVTLDIPTVSVRCSIDEPRKIYDGLQELISKNVIAKHRNDNEYYVNPACIFRGGDRRVLLTKEDY